MPTNNTTYIINTVELPLNASGTAYIPNGLDPALVSGAPGTATPGTWADGPYGNFPPTGPMLPGFPDRPTTERTACAAGQPIIDSVAPATFSHTAGAALTIKGSRFTGVVPATGVTLGGTACTSVVVVNDSTITAVSPTVGTGPATSPVVVTNPKGASPAFNVSLT
jgi:hypothetical protein